MSHVCVVTNHRQSPFYIADPHGREQAAGTRDAVCRALQDLGHSIAVVEAGPSLLERLIGAAPDVIFNLATGYRSKKDQAGIVAMLELLDIPFTGSESQVHLLGLHKHLSKMALAFHGVATPKFAVIRNREESVPSAIQGLAFPLIVKPASEGSSAGISGESVVSCADAVFLQVQRALDRFGPPVLAEEFIAGREFTVGLVGYPVPEVLPVEEIVFRKGGFYTYDVKSRDAVDPVCPADLPPECAVELQALARRTFSAIGCRDVARVDIRVSSEGKPYVLEINTLPGLMPGYSELPRMAEKAGITFTELVGRLLDGALVRLLDRYGNSLAEEVAGAWQKG